MGKQFKSLREKDREFIKKQKLFYFASVSDAEVNLSPKGYDTIRVLDEKTLVFLDYPGSGNRTYRDIQNDGEFTLLFNAFEGKANILRLFCKARVVQKNTNEYGDFLALFGEEESLVRHFFLFDIYAVETSCGDSVPFMKYEGKRDSLLKWARKLDGAGTLQKYVEEHIVPPDIKNL